MSLIEELKKKLEGKGHKTTEMFQVEKNQEIMIFAAMYLK